ncbi:hypothetical protein L9F63_016549, partial [Diploptera punctata]
PDKRKRTQYMVRVYSNRCAVLSFHITFVMFAKKFGVRGIWVHGRFDAPDCSGSGFGKSWILIKVDSTLYYKLFVWCNTLNRFIFQYYQTPIILIQ